MRWNRRLGRTCRTARPRTGLYVRDVSTYTARAERRGRLLRLGEWCARHCVVVLVLWLLALGGLHVLQSAFGGTYSDDFDLSGTQSSTGADLLRAHDPAAGGTGAQVVLHDAQKPLTEVSGQVDQVVGNLEKLPHVLSAQNPCPRRPPPRPPRCRRTGRRRTSPYGST